MNVLEEVAQLKGRAIELLIAERDRIDRELETLGHEKTAPSKKRGRPSKQALPEQPSFLPETTPLAGS